MVHSSQIVRERKDPQNPAVYWPICEVCNDAYLTKQLIMPFWKNSEKLRAISSARELEYSKLSREFNAVYGELYTKHQIVGLS